MRVSFAGTEDFVLSLSERLEWKWVGNLEERGFQVAFSMCNL